MRAAVLGLKIWCARDLVDLVHLLLDGKVVKEYIDILLVLRDLPVEKRSDLRNLAGHAVRDCARAIAIWRLLRTFL